MTTTELIERYEQDKASNMKAYERYCRQPDRDLILNFCYLSPFVIVAIVAIILA